MALASPVFCLGVVLLSYLASFVVFAILRIITGISIQRIGYLSLRHIAYTPKDGIRLDIRGLGLHLHRPTFAQPTWISLKFTELRVTVDLKTLAAGQDGGGSSRMEDTLDAADGPNCTLNWVEGKGKPLEERSRSQRKQSRTWERMTELKEKIKRLQRKIHWLRLVDVIALNSMLIVTDIACLQIGTFTMAVDTRRKTVDRSRLFQHKKTPRGEQRPAEWMFGVRSVLLTPESKHSLEILDACGLNIHGLLYKEREGLRDASVSLKLGRVHVPYDDLVTCFKRIQHCRRAYAGFGSTFWDGDISMTSVMDELYVPGSREQTMVQTVSDWKEFVSSILRGIQEVQLAVSFIDMSKRIHSVQSLVSPLYLNIAMNEVGIDLHRLDPKSPAHRTYFSTKDIAHEALLAAISIAISIDDGSGNPDRLIYVPMATTTIKTTLPSKTIAYSEDQNVTQRNANILFANVVVTSPSLDLDPRHLPLVIDLLQSRSMSSGGSVKDNHHLISRLLPKASIRLSVHEPVIRIVLAPADLKSTDPEDYDLLISSISSISLDVESSHSATDRVNYSLISNFRIASHQLYYQTATGDRHNLLVTQALELRVEMYALPEVHVLATGNLKTFSVHLVRSEISAGLHQIVKPLRNGAQSGEARSLPTSRKVNFLRRLPSWLHHFSLQGSDFRVGIAGSDREISQNARGVALQLESWTAEYKAHKNETSERRPLSSRRRMSQLAATTEELLAEHVSPMRPTKKTQDAKDGRRLAVHFRNLEGYIIDSLDSWESSAFLSLPRLEIALTSSEDSQGPIYHVNSFIQTLYLNYSLYRHYAIAVACIALRNSLHGTQEASDRVPAHQTCSQGPMRREPLDEIEQREELMTIDVKASLLQIKMTMPSDPPMMVQIYDLDTGHHRWAAPFMRASLVRLYVEAPRLKHVWARIVSIRNHRLDLRRIRRKSGKTLINEKSIDISADFIRLAVPHQFVLHKVFDNLVNVVKVTEQLHHRFRTGTNEYVLEKHPNGPKQVPRISVRSKTMQFELEDGPFEWKLGLIYRLGLVEQKHRLARESAFKVKTKKIEEAQNRRGSSRFRTQTSRLHPRGRSKLSQNDEVRHRSNSNEARPRRRSTSGANRGRHMRYDPEGVCDLSSEATVTVEKAWKRLQEYESRSWKKRIDRGLQYQNAAMQEIRRMISGADEAPESGDQPEYILGIPARPGLMSALIRDFMIVIDKPSFPIAEYRTFLHRVGKGMPFDMEYSLLIPINVQIDMGETRLTLRDYPLPLLHVPAIKLGQAPRLPSWSLKTDFVIAEEFRASESTRHVQVKVIPPEKFSQNDRRSYFAIDVRRTVSPVKTYSNVIVDINTGHPTCMTWGTSYQPAIQDMMMIIEGFTKPQVDPSERTGFWDKIRLSVHSRINVRWKGEGDVHLRLKGARDPYLVTSHGAGFIMCWRNNVQWSIHEDNDPKKFMTVSSGEYVLAIPDYNHQAHRAMDAFDRDGGSGVSSSSSSDDSAIFKKVVMKLSGNVRWLAGLVFERNVNGGGRSFAFRPHYDVTLKNARHSKDLKQQGFDAFQGFRSHHIHLSLAVVAPLNRDWSVTNLKPSSNYNTVHLTPRFFTHFFNWWSMFSGVMSLPVRQGNLWPGLEKSSKKFGRHLATIKYNLLLSPLFIAHIYKHKDTEDYTEDAVTATGLKLKLDSFMLDLHQRREEFAAQAKGPVKPIKTSGMRIDQAQLDFISADVRAVSASIAGTTPEDVKRASDEGLASYQNSVASVDLSRFTIPDNDLSWIDMDDFVELDWILPAELNPTTKIMPLAFAPRFSYFRQTDHEDSVSHNATRSSTFGNEPTHFCVMSQDNDPRRVQSDLIRERIEKINQQIESHRRVLGEQELRVVRDSYKDQSPKEQFDILDHQGKVLRSKKDFLQSVLEGLSQRLQWRESAAPELGSDEQGPNGSQSKYDFTNQHAEAEAEVLEAAPLAELVSDFNNRFIAHNVQLKWNNALRDIILRYVHQVSQRRGFVYYMSRRAVKFILDIVEEQHKAKNKFPESPMDNGLTSVGSPPVPISPKDASGLEVESRIQQLLDDGKKFVEADDPASSESAANPRLVDTETNIAMDFTPQNSYYVRLIAPQIQLQSEKNAKSVLLVTAKGMELKVVQIMDKDRMADDVSGLVQRRFSVDMDSVQFFVSDEKTLLQYLHMYSGTRYGTREGSAWPPWVPMEVMFDFKLNPFGFSRVVERTSASLRYDKYNTLRLKYNDEVTGGEPGHEASMEDTERRIDHLWVDFPQIRARCDSDQYYTMYIIALDLLLFNEPLEKVRSEKLEKIMLASDFSDLRGAPETVTSLQERIRQLEEIKTQFQINAKYLDLQGWQDRLAIERDLANCETELFFMMKAITTSQRKGDERSQSSSTNGLLRWYLSASEVVWHLMREKNEPLVEFQLRNAVYDRIDNSDGSNHNTMAIERVRGLNLLRDAMYPEMIGPYFENGRPFTESATKMLRVQWHMLEAIAGIPVLDQFEVDLFPLKIQLEREIGKKLFEYIFPGIGSNALEGEGVSPPTIETIQSMPAEDDSSDSGGGPYDISSEQVDFDTEMDQRISSSGAGSLELRLKPTMTLPDKSHPKSSMRSRSSIRGQGIPNGESQHFKLFQHSNRTTSTRTSQSIRTVSKKSSADRLLTTARRSHDASSSNLSGLNSNGEKVKKFGLNPSASKDVTKEKDKPSDDLTQMISRASNYMTLAYVKIPSVVLCLSYKGKGERNIEDVHDFVFRMPALEYRNKTWSKLDLALRLKKDVIRALISHTGAIIGNKFSHHRPNKQQQSRLREIANSSMLLPNTEAFTDTTDAATSPIRSRSSDRSTSPRRSFNSGGGSQLARSASYASSLKSLSTRSATFTSEPASIPESRAESGDESYSYKHHGLPRSVTTNGRKWGRFHQNDGNDDEIETSKRKSSVVLLGKKILGSRN